MTDEQALEKAISKWGPNGYTQKRNQYSFSVGANPAQNGGSVYGTGSTWEEAFANAEWHKDDSVVTMPLRDM
jgi:hypothetical protein